MEFEDGSDEAATFGGYLTKSSSSTAPLLSSSRGRLGRLHRIRLAPLIGRRGSVAERIHATGFTQKERDIEAVGICQRRLEDLPPLQDQPAAKDVEAVIRAAAPQQVGAQISVR